MSSEGFPFFFFFYLYSFFSLLSLKCRVMYSSIAQGLMATKMCSYPHMCKHLVV